MKNAIIIVGLLVYMQSCASLNPQILENRLFVDQDSLKYNSLQFINDSICIYTQEFAWDIGEQLQKTEIRCRYRIEKNRIILDAVKSPEFIEGKTCYSLPDSIKDIFISRIVTKKWPLRVYNQQMDSANYYCYINGINTDTITYYKDDLIYIKHVYMYPSNPYIHVAIFKGNKNPAYHYKKRGMYRGANKTFISSKVHVNME